MAISKKKSLLIYKYANRLIILIIVLLIAIVSISSLYVTAKMDNMEQKLALSIQFFQFLGIMLFSFLMYTLTKIQKK